MSTSIGSSPLARGTHILETASRGDTRLIPARAGNTAPGPAGPAVRSAHPRSRGEHGTGSDFTVTASGSSPLARGTPRQAPTAPAPQRLIPARAGNTGQLQPHISSSSAHPRSRGEHSSWVVVWGSMYGSSPLARGTHIKRASQVIKVRLIPARAGNTSPRPHSGRPRAAHPRSRGEHVTAERTPSRAAGSSPLARGTRCVD